MTARRRDVQTLALYYTLIIDVLGRPVVFYGHRKMKMSRASSSGRLVNLLDSLEDGPLKAKATRLQSVKGRNDE